MTNLQQLSPAVVSRDEAAWELWLRRKARREMLAFVCYVMPEYSPQWYHAVLCNYLDQFVEGNFKRLMVFMPPQHGKLLDAKTPVLTTRGWKAHGELSVGDMVFGHDGKPVKVLGNSGGYRWHVERVQFAGGASLLAAREHEWVLECNRDKRAKDGKRIGRQREVLETQQIFDGYHAKSPAVRIAPALDVGDKELPIDPYVLGCWLGDGHSAQGVLTVGSEDIAHFQSLGEAREVKPGVYRVLVNGLTAKLRACGVLHNKHIPVEYLTAGIEQRWELLRGLMDTDGCVDFRGRCEFTQKSGQLASDVFVLLRTLGIKASANEYAMMLQKRHVGYKKRICFTPSRGERVFNLPRKQSKLESNPQQSRDDKLFYFVESIEPYGEVLGNCIEVEGGVYLAGEHLIPTHNSQLVSRMLPAYVLGRDPDAKIIAASYAAELIQGMNRDVQRVIEGDEYKRLFPETRLNEKNIRTVAGSYLRNNDIFEIVGRKGGYRCAGVGGGLTGFRSDYGIIDDPFKDYKEATSATVRNAVWEWYSSVFLTRTHSQTRILLTLTRWHEDDLAARLLESEGTIEEGGLWKVLKLPALCEDPNAPDEQRQSGEALWPERFPVETLLERKKLNPHQFEALYQQNPSPREGAFFKIMNLQIVDAAPSGLREVRAWDIASSEGSGDYTAGVKIGTAGDGVFYITDVVRGQWDTDNRDKMMKLTAQRDGSKVKIKIPQDPGAAGKSLALAMTRMLAGYPVVAEPVTGDKVTRADPFSSQVNAGNVRLVRGEWNQAFIEELRQFPNGHDDQVDAASDAFNALARKREFFVV